MISRTVLLALVLLTSAHSSVALAQDVHEQAMAVVDRSGVDDNLPTLLKAYAPLTTTGQITLRGCETTEWKAHLGIGVARAVAKHGATWDEANAKILLDNLTPEEIAAVLDYEPKQMQAETYGKLPPEVLRSALDGQLQPIIQLALVDVTAYLFEHCAGPTTP
jgi:hypothetical protein